jgi:hypothetical protein
MTESRKYEINRLFDIVKIISFFHLFIDCFILVCFFEITFKQMLI